MFITVFLKDEVQGSDFSGIGNWQESKMYLTDTRIAIVFFSYKVITDFTETLYSVQSG